MFSISLQLIAALFVIVPSPTLPFEFRHHDNDELVAALEKIHEDCKNISRIYTLSETSVNGKPLYLIEFSTRPGHHELRKFLLKCYIRCQTTKEYKNTVSASSIDSDIMVS